MGKKLKNNTIEASKIQKLLRQVYYGLDSSAAFAGAQKVYDEAKRRDKKINMGDVMDFLNGERTYTMHRPARKRFPRLHTIPSGLHTDWQCDLAIFDALKRENDGYAYLLVCIDVLSRKIVVSPVKSKRSENMIEAFDKVFEKTKGIKPHKLYSDSGVEFQAKKMLDYFAQKDILKRVMYSPNLHAGVVERTNRTIKERLYRYFSERNTERWIDVIDKIVDGINGSVNRMTGLRPDSVTFDNAEDLMKRLYKDEEEGKGYQQKNKTVTKFSVGNIVRISKEKGAFGKGYHPNYTDELFRIRAVSNAPSNTLEPPHYIIEDLEGELIKGVFYTPELVLTKEDTTHRVAEILKSRTIRNGIKEHFVRWVGYSKKHNSWIKETDIIGGSTRT